MSEPIFWRGIILEPHGQWMWLSANRTWKVTTFSGAGFYIAHCQIDLARFFTAQGDTPPQALDNVALVTAEFAELLSAALREVQ